LQLLIIHNALAHDLLELAGTNPGLQTKQVSLASEHLKQSLTQPFGAHLIP